MSALARRAPHSPRCGGGNPKTVLQWLKHEARHDSGGRKAVRALFAQRWPLLYSDLLHSENVTLMKLDEADAAEREIADAIQREDDFVAAHRWWSA